MYSIVEEYVNGFNGLILAAKKKSNAYKNDNWGPASVSTAVSSAHTLLQQANEGRETGAPAVIGSKTFATTAKTVAKATTAAATAAPATAQTAATPAPTTGKKSVWPWIVGGLAVLGVGYMILKK